MSKREYLLQKGLQLKALNEAVEGTGAFAGGKQAREVAKYRELCPPGTEDSQIVQLLAQTKGDAQRTENAISELWEDYRGSGQDEWATVEKKGKKKEPSFLRRDGPKNSYRQSQKPQFSDEQTADADTPERSGGRGFGSTRGRGAPAARGGRGGGRGRGRGGITRGGSRVQNGETDEDAEGENGEESAVEQAPRKEGGVKQAETQPAVATPPPVIPHLTGAWTKKPSFVQQAKPKPAQPPAPTKPVEKPASAPAPTSTPASATPAAPASSTPSETAAPVVKEAPKVASPKKSPAPVSPKKVASPAPEAKKAVEKVASPKAEKKLESPSISAWGSLDVSTSSIGEWPSAEKKTTQTPNAWARGSPILSSVVATESTTTVSAVTPTSPKEAQGSAGASPKYLKLGRWDTGASANLSLQFGSFSLNGVEHVESTSPRGWASTTVTTTTSTSKTETQSAWGTVSPKKKTPLSPTRATESESHDTTRKQASTTSAPPGLSVESGRVTPKSGQSPRTFAPSAPSPAALPKPDEVKRSTPTRSQGAFQSSSQGGSKIGSGSTYGSDFSSKSSSLYQSSYGQYSMGIGGGAGQSSTPKGSNNRSGAATAAAVQSPSHGAQPAQQQQQQQKATQQTQQRDAQQQQQQQQQGQAHGQQQNVPPHHQAGPPGYHPHYAPPPPPGMAMAYNPYNYASYYQGYGYYQNPQYAQYSPRTQYPPRGSMPYGVEGPMPGYSNPPVGFQDQHLLAHQHDYPGAIPQGFGEISGAYLQQPGHHHHLHQQSGPQSHSKGSSQMSSSQQQRSGSGMQGYQNASGSSSREHGASAPPVPNPSAGGGGGAAAAGSYGQHYGWASYGAQPMGAWGHMMPQGYQQNPSQHQHPGSHQQSYRQYGGNNSQSGNSGNESSSGTGGHAHAWSS
ncbi:hypothetical protein Poli38472_004294 [Pythium oligandrum]|uniref:Uncharacterized protein n=1 Tax=Pythium oligandrum TaxID=41045 RepID=A0A8K1CNU9_PYTOL|nr:hypothetical protein Poli38472_004294 [Pythium oligandrum]|eukprot:TMW66529.1 hypothetical protein Poli38472_004294 [Pythium oligandrum]